MTPGQRPGGRGVGVRTAAPTVRTMTLDRATLEPLAFAGMTMTQMVAETGESLYAVRTACRRLGLRPGTGHSRDGPCWPRSSRRAWTCGS